MFGAEGFAAQQPYAFGAGAAENGVFDAAADTFGGNDEGQQFR
ncbi:hypothetical protein AB0N65_04380 [Paenarthrobacter sp. NPDC089322]